MDEFSINLLTLAKTGDDAAWQTLLTNIYPRALQQARMLLRDQDLAEDAVQNALVKVYTHLSSLQDLASFQAWWQRVLTNEVYMTLRIRMRESQANYGGFASGLGLAVDELATLRVELARVLKHLPLDQQQAVIDFDLRGLSMQEMAMQNNLPLGTIKSRLFRARVKLQQGLYMYKTHAKEGSNMPEQASERTLSERFYDYLEGTMEPTALATFKCELSEHPEWQQMLEQHRAFLTLLHTLSGRLTLSANDILEKARSLHEKTRDYEQIVDETYVLAGVPETLSAKIWFKAPGLYRTESVHPTLGKLSMIIRENTVLTLMEDARQASRLQISQELMDSTGFDFLESLKQMAADKRSHLLGTEYLNGRPTLHIQFFERANGQDEMATHLWMDKETWMPLVTEKYNANGELANRKVVRELRLNQGIPDSLFALDIPEGYEVQDGPEQPLQPLKDVSLDEAVREIGYPPYVLDDQDYHVKRQLIDIPSGVKILLSQYYVPGEQIPRLTVTQGEAAHSNIPPQMSQETVVLEFANAQIEGVYVDFNISPIKGIAIWCYSGVHFTCGGNLEKEALLAEIARLRIHLQQADI